MKNQTQPSAHGMQSGSERRMISPSCVHAVDVHAWAESIASTEDTSMCWPRPDFRIHHSAVSVAMVACDPAWSMGWLLLIVSGSRSAWPMKYMYPPMALSTISSDFQWRYGPVCPKWVTEVIISDGFSADSES